MNATNDAYSALLEINTALLAAHQEIIAQKEVSVIAQTLTLRIQVAIARANGSATMDQETHANLEHITSELTKMNTSKKIAQTGWMSGWASTDTINKEDVQLACTKMQALAHLSMAHLEKKLNNTHARLGHNILNNNIDLNANNSRLLTPSDFTNENSDRDDRKRPEHGNHD